MCGSTRLGDQLELSSVLPYLTVPPARAARPRVLVSKLHAWAQVRSLRRAVHNLVPDPELTPSCRTELRKGHDYFQHYSPPSLSLQPSSVFGTSPSTPTRGCASSVVNCPFHRAIHACAIAFCIRIRRIPGPWDPTLIPSPYFRHCLSPHLLSPLHFNPPGTILLKTRSLTRLNSDRFQL